MNNEDLKYIFDKQLDWIAKADSKATAILTVSGVLLTILFTSSFLGPDLMMSGFKKGFISVVYVIIGLIFFGTMLAAILYSFITLIPTLAVKNNKKEASLIYFKDIAELDNEAYKNHFLSATSSQLENSLIQEIYNNASIANIKMTYCQNATKLFMGSTLSLIILFIICIFNK